MLPCSGFLPHRPKKCLFWGILQWDAPAPARYSHVEHVAESSHLLIPLLRDFEELVAVGEGVRPGGNLQGRAQARQPAAASLGAPAHRPPGTGLPDPPVRAPGTESLCWPRRCCGRGKGSSAAAQGDLDQHGRGWGRAGTRCRTHHPHLHQHLPHGWEKGAPRFCCPSPQNWPCPGCFQKLPQWR